MAKKKINKDVVQAVKDKFISDESDLAKSIVDKANSYLELAEKSLDEGSEQEEPPALEALEMMLKAILDQITDSIIDEVVDNKLEGNNMTEYKQSLDESMDHVLTVGQHFSKMMMKHGDEKMKSFYTKAHSLAMKLADVMKEHRKSMGIEDYKEKDGSFYQASFGEDVQSIKSLSEKTEAIAKESILKLSEELEAKEDTIRLLSDKLLKIEKEEVVKKAISDRKLTDSMKQWALSLSKEDLESYLRIAPTIAAPRQTATPIKDVVPEVIPVDVEVQLSERDLAMINELGISKEHFIKSRKTKSYK